MVALRSLYPKVSPGGWVIIDDYALKGCKAAVDDFVAQENLRPNLETVDWTGLYWRKDG